MGWGYVFQVFKITQKKLNVIDFFLTILVCIILFIMGGAFKLALFFADLFE